ncbi:hypothetical protein D8M38_12285 [Kocuria sp. HSID17582]|nr:hypothetical protein D8M39_03695 [Kocuria sp. HSID17590]RUQ02753.1 hypothetical protein D8M38_12285 [Kocuria sp. HSID17582]
MVAASRPCLTSFGAVRCRIIGVHQTLSHVGRRGTGYQQDRPGMQAWTPLSTVCPVTLPRGLPRGAHSGGSGGDRALGERTIAWAARHRRDGHPPRPRDSGNRPGGIRGCSWVCCWCSSP